MTSPAMLTRLEDIIDTSGAAPRIEAMLPAGVRHRQLRVRTLLLGMMLTLADRRPAHLTRVHEALTALPGADQARLGVTEEWKTGPHQLTYRQAERTFGLITAALEKQKPDGTPSAALATVLDDLLEASIPAEHKATSTALAADWTDVESFSRPPHHGSSDCADPEASWGHRNSNLPGPKGELFFGYYLSAATMVREETGPAVPELTRRITLSSCHADPVRAFAPVLARMPGNGIALGDMLADSGYAHRDAAAWALPLRAAGAQLVCDLHPHDRGPQGTIAGAIIANGNLYCPATPGPLLHLGPLAPAATPDDTAAHDIRTAELARHKLGRRTADDADGYHRVTCPAVMGKLRCPLRPASMTLDRSRPEILTPPQHPPPAAPSRPSPSALTSRRKPGRNTTTPRRRTAAPMPAAPPRNGASPRSRTRLATPSAAAGAASWACHHSRSGWPACTPSETSASSPPGTPARLKTSDAPPPGSRPGQGNAGGKPPWPASPHRRKPGPPIASQPRRSPARPRQPTHASGQPASPSAATHRPRRTGKQDQLRPCGVRDTFVGVPRLGWL